MTNVLVICNRCQRPFGGAADCCPDCGAVRPLGKQLKKVQIASILISVAALTAASVLIVGQTRAQTKTTVLPTTVTVSNHAEESSSALSEAKIKFAESKVYNR